MNTHKISVENLNKEIIKTFKADDSVLLSGVIYTARDAAHKRMCEEYNSGKGFPFDIKGKVIYYAGPCPAKPGEIIGSCGPTTAGRMDAYTPLLLDNGLLAMIGKGARDKKVIDAIKSNTCVYLGAIGGAGALYAQAVRESELIAYEDLGTEAIRKLTVKDFPCTVLIDSDGNDIYETGKMKYKKL